MPDFAFPRTRRLTLTEHAMIVLALDRAGFKEATALADFLRDARIKLWVDLTDSQNSL